MNESHIVILSLTLYKVVAILAGLAFTFMGYKLFIHGIFTEAGELQTNWENRSLVLKKAAPGTFFALFGTVIVCVSLWRGLTLEPSKEQGSVGGSGFFSIGASQGNDQNWQTPTSGERRQTVLNDIAILNQLANEIIPQREQGKISRMAITIENGDRILDLIDRTKTTLMLSVWSQDWGDQEEFIKWAQGAPGYFYSDPPTGIAIAAAIYKGEAK